MREEPPPPYSSFSGLSPMPSPHSRAASISCMTLLAVLRELCSRAAMFGGECGADVQGRACARHMEGNHSHLGVRT